MSVCVVPLSQPSSRDLVYPLLGCFVSEKKRYIYIYIYIKKILDIAITSSTSILTGIGRSIETILFSSSQYSISISFTWMSDSPATDKGFPKYL